MMKSSVNLRLVFALLPLLCAAARGQQAYKIDGTDYARCDLSEVPHVTDLPSPLFVELGKHPEAKAAVVVYSPLPGDGIVYAHQIKSWLTEARGVAAGRVLAVYGGYAGKRRVEIWLVPAGAEPPRDAPPVTRAGVTLFGHYYYYGGESCPDNHRPALEAFASALKRLPGWRGTIVLRPHVNRRGARGGDEDFDPAPLTRRQAARRAAADRLHLIKRLGLDPARVRAVVGAPDTWAHGELWLIPPTAQASGGR